MKINSAESAIVQEILKHETITDIKPEAGALAIVTKRAGVEIVHYPVFQFMPDTYRMHSVIYRLKNIMDGEKKTLPFIHWFVTFNQTLKDLPANVLGKNRDEDLVRAARVSVRNSQ